MEDVERRLEDEDEELRAEARATPSLSKALSVELERAEVASIDSDPRTHS